MKMFFIPITITNSIVSYNLASCILGLTGFKSHNPEHQFSGKPALGMGNSPWLTQPMRTGHGAEMMMIRQLLETWSG